MEFGRGLTCIIGARGTCKSTLIESIRFAFESEECRVATLVGDKSHGEPGASTFGIIGHTLGAGSVRCELATTDGTSQRAITLEHEIGGEPRIFLDGVREHTKRDLLRDIEIFSQGDLQRVADDDNDHLRLALIDRQHRNQVARLNAKRREAAEKLRRLGPDIRATQGQLSTLDHEITQLDPARIQLDRLAQDAPTASPALEAERQEHERRQRILDALERIETRRKGLADHLGDARAQVRHITELASSIEADMAGVSDRRTTLLTELTGAAEEVMTSAERVDSARLTPLIEALRRDFEEASELYYQLRQQEQAVNESLKQQDVLKRQVQHLEELQSTADATRVTQTDLLATRSNLRSELRRIDDEIYDLRITEIDSINSEHGDTVQLTLGSSWSSTVYARRLRELLAGSGIRSQDEVARAIAETVEPSALIDLTEAGDATRLADRLGRDLGQMTRVIAQLADHSKLYELEALVPANRLDVTFFDDGEPKPVKTLSKGQRATAILPIILRPLPYPLLFDQPEDDLDNNFIFKSLITTLRQLKTERQLIFVTHNANIPVLGAADKVIVMSMQKPTRAAPALTGSVDDRKQEILDLLEGGAEAFVERERYYYELLTEPDGGVAKKENPKP